MPPERTSTSTKRAVLGLGLAAAVLAAPYLTDRAVTEARQRRIAEEAERRARDAAERTRDALALQTEAVALMAENAVANPRFLAALRGRVDRQTFADLLSTESWWAAYRGFLAAISYDGGTLAFAQTEGADGLRIGEIMRDVDRTGKAASRPMAGDRGAFLVAASPVSVGPGSAPAVLLLARRLDRPMLDTLAAKAEGAILVSDGSQALGRGGRSVEMLEPLVGRERGSDFMLADPAARAAVVPIGSGLWLWSLGRARAIGQAAAAADKSRRRVLWALAIPLALLIGGVSLWRPKRNPADPRQEQPGALPANATRFGLAASAPAGGAAGLLAAVPPGPGMPLGRYLLVDQIGEGGMAEVFTAISFGYGGFRRSFVIKRLRPELNGNTTAVDLFIDEANLALTLVHQNVVPVFDFGEAGGSYFLAQEYIVGRDLGRVTRRLRERGEPLLSANAILYFASEVLAGLQYAHDKRDDSGQVLGLVHRDITPENIMISERGEVKILDFGIMKARQRVSQTLSGTVKGSVAFMSPEQARGKAVDHRSDLFSTGLVILYAATGERIYPGDTFYDLLTAAAEGPGDAQRARIGALPDPLPSILDRALQVDPDRRFQTSAAFRAAIAPFLTSGGPNELSDRLVALFGEELRAEQERLAGAFAPTSSPVAAEIVGRS